MSPREYVVAVVCLACTSRFERGCADIPDSDARFPFFGNLALYDPQQVWTCPRCGSTLIRVETEEFHDPP